MKKIPVGLQMATLRELCSQDFLGTLEQVADIGYAGVELLGLWGHDPGEVREVLDDLNLTLVGNHAPGERDMSRLVSISKDLGCPAVWGSCMPEAKLPNDEADMPRNGRACQLGRRGTKEEGNPVLLS